MRYNGTLQYEIRTDNGVNEYGEPIPAEAVWSEPTPCLITTNSDSRLGKYEDGEFRQASFTILIEANDFTASRVRLQRHREALGEFRVMSVSPLLTVGRTQILV